jgi:hypothetical protein
LPPVCELALVEVGEKSGLLTLCVAPANGTEGRSDLSALTAMPEDEGVDPLLQALARIGQTRIEFLH